MLLVSILFLTFQSFALMSPQDLQNLKSKLKTESAVAESSCLTTLPIAKSIYAEDANDLPALQTIAKCSSAENVNRYASETKEIFERSKILSIVPKLLEVAQVKDLVPILKEVEVKKDKSLTDYLMINEIYERLGEPEKQMQTLKDAMTAAPSNPLPMILLATEQFKRGQTDQTEGLFKSYLAKAEPFPGQMYFLAYVMALAYPLAVSIGMVALIWAMAALITYRKVVALKDWPEVTIGMPILVLFLPPILAFRFYQTGKALPLGALLFFFGVQIFFLAQPVLRKVYVPVFKFISKIFYFILNGTLLAKKLNSFSAGTKVLISLATIVVLGTIAPTIDIPDLRYAVIFFCSLILYSTIGSLLIGFLRSRTSLVTSLRWIGIAATLPFLISYLVSNWKILGAPLLYGQLPSANAVDGLTSYLLFWGVSFFLASHLGKIIAHAVIEPINEISDKVNQIEKGQFDAKVQIISKDEIGSLGSAINRMGEGLQKREKIEKTFRKYVDHQIAERILDGLESEVRIEGTRVDAVVLFADVRGFTTLSEKTPPEEIVKMLNQFFERMVGIVQRHQGVIDKFIGDNMMVVWGVPKSIEDAERKAVTAGMEMLAEMKKWNEELQRQGKSEVGIGIGINCGPMIAGSVGSSERMEYTVIGDTVNTAQRAESIAKRQQLVLTDAMYDRVKDIVTVQALEPIKVKGKEGLMTWFSVESLKDSYQKSA